VSMCRETPMFSAQMGRKAPVGTVLQTKEWASETGILARH
jgi:hypothetical protein